MISAPAVPQDCLGVQQPRVSWIPPYATSAGQEAVELAELAGLELDPWEKFVLVNSLNEREDGRWAAFEVGLCVPRQNGKGSILEARELAGMFLLGEKLLIHSAHEQKTATEHFLRLLSLIEGMPEFARRILKAPRGKGAEAIELRGGQRIFFKTRTGGGGRGLSGDFVALDEAMDLPVPTVGALMPTLSARSVMGNPQLWYSGSAVDQDIHEHGLVFARIRERGLKGGDPSLMYAEWSADGARPDSVDGALLDDPSLWAQANPGLGIRISAEHVSNERRSMDHRTFCVERLGIGDWPNPDGLGKVVIDPERWRELTDPESVALDPVWFAVDVTPNRSGASIAAAGVRADGLMHVEVVDRRNRLGWLRDRLAQLVEQHKPAGIVCDGGGPVASVLPQLEEAGLPVTVIGMKEHTQACGRFFDMVEERQLRHLGSADLRAAIAGAGTRPLGEAWAWSRKFSSADISPLVASTLALWKAETAKPTRTNIAHFL